MTFQSITQNLPESALIFAIIIGYLMLLWQTLNLITPFNDDEELFDKGNVAYLLQRLGIVAAQIIAMLAVIGDFNSLTPLNSAFWLAIEGAWVFIALLTARFVVDWVLFPKVKNVELLKEGNIAVGIVEAGFYVGLGFILQGSLTGTASSNSLSFLTTVVFYALGLAFVCGVYILHSKLTPFKLAERLQAGSISSALELAGLLVATSVVVKGGVAGDFTSWSEALEGFAVVSITSIALLYLLRLLVDVAVLRGHTVKSIQEEERTAPAALLAGLLILISFPIASVVNQIL